MVGLSTSIPEERVVSASDVLAKIKAGQPAEFDNCNIVDYLNLSTLKIEGDVHFNNTLFQNFLNCESATFINAAYFVDSNFNDTADFGYANFNGRADFRLSKFNSGVNPS
jgi:hypothetical protein